MSSVSVSRIKLENLYTRTFLQAYRADPGLGVLTGYYGLYHSILGPTVSQKVFFFSDRYKILPNRFFYNKNILLDILVAQI